MITALEKRRDGYAHRVLSSIAQKSQYHKQGIRTTSTIEACVIQGIPELNKDLSMLKLIFGGMILRQEENRHDIVKRLIVHRLPSDGTKSLDNAV
jgi:hypothetical protein